jgi:MFS family permease
MGSIGVSLAFAFADQAWFVAALVLVAGISYGAFYTPGMTLLTDAAEDRNIAPGLAFGAMNGAWAAGNVFGPSVGGWLADVAGDSLPYILLAGLCTGTLALTLSYVQPRLRPSSS